MRDGRKLSREALAIVRRKAVESVISGELTQTQAAAEMALEIRCGASAEEDGLTGYWVEESR